VRVVAVVSELKSLNTTIKNNFTLVSCFVCMNTILGGPLLAGGQGEGGAAAPPGPVEPDKSSLWIEDFHYSKDCFL